MWLQKISITNSRKVIGNSEGKSFEEMHEAKMGFPYEWGVQTEKKAFCGKGMTFSGRMQKPEAMQETGNVSWLLRQNQKKQSSYL